MSTPQDVLLPVMKPLSLDMVAHCRRCLPAQMEQLQDEIPAFDTKEAMEVVQAELGYPPSQLVSTLASTPTAAASLVQVRLSSGIATAHMSMLQLCILACRQAMLTFRCPLV